MSEISICSVKQVEQEASIWERYRSRPRVLARWLLESRDRWKEKYVAIKQEVKRLKVRVTDIHKSREHWKEIAKLKAEELVAMKSEFDRLRQQVEQTEIKM